MLRFAPRQATIGHLVAPHLSSSRRPISSSAPHRLRAYRYHVDVHGQLFLHDTTPKNLSSCFKNPTFLDFFFARVRRNEASSDGRRLAANDEPDWVDDANLDEASASSLAQSYGYSWLSPCQGELNFIRVDATPIVFRELSEGGKLRWAGSYEVDFEPERLRVCSTTGYVYHPSPRPPLSRYRRDPSLPTPYGRYSLLGSALVLQRLTEGLDVRSDGLGGSIEWQGKRHEVGVLQEGDLAASNG